MLPAPSTRFEPTPFPDTYPQNIPVLGGVHSMGFTEGPAGNDTAHHALSYHIYSCGFAVSDCDENGDLPTAECDICDKFVSAAVETRTADIRRTSRLSRRGINSIRNSIRNSSGSSNSDSSNSGSSNSGGSSSNGSSTLANTDTATAAAAVGGGIMITEFGACSGSATCLAEINRVTTRADAALQSWACKFTTSSPHTSSANISVPQYRLHIRGTHAP